VDKARNDLSAAVPKFCLALEEYRRTPDGRVRTSQDFVTSFFPHDDKGCTDRVFKHIPNEVRGPIVAAWGIRGVKAALRDTDDKIKEVVHDALLAGDVDHVAFEEGLAPETLVRWLPLSDVWSFWRAGKLSKQAISKALTTAYDLFLFDARWFLETLQGKSGAVKGTDVLAEGLTKDELIAWIKRIHETGDGSPKGIVAALGWEKIVAKTPNDSLIAVLDAMVSKVGLTIPASTPQLPTSETTPEIKTEPPGAPEAPALEARLSERGSLDENGWAAQAAAKEEAGEQGEGAPLSAEESINIVLEEELIINDGSGGGTHVIEAVSPKSDEPMGPLKLARERFRGKSR
jgi:hypothetical protein